MAVVVFEPELVAWLSVKSDSLAEVSAIVEIVCELGGVLVVIPVALLVDFRDYYVSLFICP